MSRSKTGGMVGVMIACVFGLLTVSGCSDFASDTPDGEYVFDFDIGVSGEVIPILTDPNGKVHRGDKAAELARKAGLLREYHEAVQEANEANPPQLARNWNPGGSAAPSFPTPREAEREAEERGRRDREEFERQTRERERIQQEQLARQRQQLQDQMQQRPGSAQSAINDAMNRQREQMDRIAGGGAIPGFPSGRPTRPSRTPPNVPSTPPRTSRPAAGEPVTLGLEVEDIEIGEPEMPLPLVSYDPTKATRSHTVGWSLASGEKAVEPPEGAVIVGMIFGFDNSGRKALKNVQPVFQIGDEYIEGDRIGESGGKRTLEMAPPGYVVYGIETQSNSQINAIRLGYMRIDERGRLKKSDMKASPWVGEQGGKTELIDGKGKAIVSIYGSFMHGETLGAVGLYAAPRLKLVKAPEALRDWKSTNGYTTSARYVSHDALKVKLRLENGDEIDVEIDALSPEDRQFIWTRASSAGQ